MKYFLLIILSFLFISCSKDGSSGTSTGTQPSYDSTCQITAVKWVLGTDSVTTVLSYNSAGKLSKTDDGRGYIVLYTYEGNKIFISSDYNTPIRDTATLNSFGYVAELNRKSDPLTFSNSFFYISDTVLTYTVYKSPLLTSPPDTTTYHFMDGDLTSFVINGTSYNYTYYTDKSEQPADLSIYKQITGQGALAFTNKHLTKSYSNNSSGNPNSEEYTYTFDASGKILTLTVQYINGQIPGTLTYYYTYACHL